MERTTNSLQQELNAMATIGQVLGDITVPATRQRVLRWAGERFAANPAPAAQVTPVLAAVEAPSTMDVDPDLAVDSLTDMFGAQPQTADDTLLLETPRLESVEKAPLETVIRSFAADFQRFAEEWNGAAA